MQPKILCSQIYFRYQGIKKNCPIDVVVNVITLSKKNDVINEYIRFTKIFDRNVKIYGYTKKSIKKTIDECVNQNILKEYLKMKKKEVTSDLATILWDQDYIDEQMKKVRAQEVKEAKEEARQKGMQVGIQKGMQVGIQKGMQEGIQKGRVNLLVSLVNENLLTLEQACKKAKMTKKSFKALLPA